VSENLDLVRSIYADWERGDFSSAPWAHPAIEFAIVGGPDAGRWTGVDGMARGWYGFLEAWEGFHVEPDEHLELDRERVLVLIHRSGIGKTSRMQVDEMHSEAADVFHISQGRVVRLLHYWDRADALRAAGLKA
jgi:ketosteroid isomerase-like protein